jgi:hypothetical protein
MSKITETPATVTDETAEVSENETAVNSAIQNIMEQLETNFITKKSFLKRAAIISGVVGATALAIGIAIGRSSSSDDSDEETETTED